MSDTTAPAATPYHAPRFDILVSGSSLGLEGGFLGLSTIVLVESAGRRLLFDCGHYVTRRMLLDAFDQRGLTPDDIDLLVLSHAHFDHALNIDLFPKTDLVLSREEWNYIANPLPNDTATPRYMRKLLERDNLRLLSGEEELLPGVVAFPTPGHSPGHMSLQLACEAGRVVLAADAIKTAQEALRRIPDLEFDPKKRGSAPIRQILARANVIVPGHFPTLFQHDDGRITWQEMQKVPLLLR